MKFLDKPCKKELYQALVGVRDVISPNCLKQVTKVLNNVFNVHQGLDAAGITMKDLMNIANKRDEEKKV